MKKALLIIVIIILSVSLFIFAKDKYDNIKEYQLNQTIKHSLQELQKRIQNEDCNDNVIFKKAFIDGELNAEQTTINNINNIVPESDRLNTMGMIDLYKNGNPAKYYILELKQGKHLSFDLKTTNKIKECFTNGAFEFIVTGKPLTSTKS